MFLLLALQQWGGSVEEALKTGKPVVVASRVERFVNAAHDGAFAFVSVDAGARPQVTVLDPKGRPMTRLYQPDAARVNAELAWALEELKTPREIPLPAEGRELIGTPAPAWTLDAWLRGDARAIEDQKGKVTLIRFFTNTCPYCTRSMPALQKLQEKHADLTVMGFFHPKPIGAKRSRASIEAMLDEWKVKFPIALDTDWKTLEAYWFQSVPRGATSASFLIDKRGVIRWIHPGPEIQPDDPELEAAVQKLLTEQ